MRRIAVPVGTQRRHETQWSPKFWASRLGLVVLLLVTVACSSSGGDYLDDYADIRDRLAPPEPAGPVIDERTETFVDTANPCDTSEVISVDLEEKVYDQGDGTVLVINESKVSTPGGFEGNGLFWLLATGPGTPPLDSGYFESAQNAQSGDVYVRYGDFPTPTEGGEYESLCVESS